MVLAALGLVIKDLEVILHQAINLTLITNLSGKNIFLQYKTRTIFFQPNAFAEVFYCRRPCLCKSVDWIKCAHATHENKHIWTNGDKEIMMPV